MDNVSENNIEIALTQYFLVKCNADLKIKYKPSTGGSLQITSELKTPIEPRILKKDDPFTINLSVEVVGKPKNSKGIAFTVSCGFEGNYKIINCGKSGIKTNDNLEFWSLAVSQLHPLASQFVLDITSKMGFKSITVPPIILGQYSLKEIPEKKSPKSKKQ